MQARIQEAADVATKRSNAPTGAHVAHTFQRQQATHRWWRRWCWRWPAFFLMWFSACSFTSRRMKNCLAHILHGNISVRVSNVTSAEGKALPIMQLAQDGLHLLSDTKHDSSIVRRLQREAVCFSSRNEEKAQFVFGPESKGSCGIGLCAGPEVFGLCRLVSTSARFPSCFMVSSRSFGPFCSNCQSISQGKCTTQQRQTSY